MVLEIPTSHASEKLPRQPKTTNTQHCTPTSTQLSATYFIPYQLFPPSSKRRLLTATPTLQNTCITSWTWRWATPGPPNTHLAHIIVLLKHQNKDNNRGKVGNSAIMREVFTKKLNEVWQRGRGRAHRSSQVWQAARGENRDRALSDKRVNTLSNKWMEEEQFQRDVKAQFTHIIKRGTEFSPTSLVMQIFPLLLVKNHIWKTQQQSLEYVFCWVHISTQDLWFWPFGKQWMIYIIIENKQ